MINYKGCKTIDRWSNFKLLAQRLPRGTEENQEKRQDMRSLDRHLNPVSPEYKAGVSTTRPRRSVGIGVKNDTGHVQSCLLGYTAV
jgi:hypothetical protein